MGQGSGDEAAVDTRIGLRIDTIQGVGETGGGSDMGGAADSEESVTRGGRTNSRRECGPPRGGRWARGALWRCGDGSMVGTDLDTCTTTLIMGQATG